MAKKCLNITCTGENECYKDIFYISEIGKLKYYINCNCSYKSDFNTIQSLSQRQTEENLGPML